MNSTASPALPWLGTSGSGSRFKQFGNVRFGSFPDIQEGPLSAKSGSSWIRRQCSDDVSLNDRYRLGAAGQVIELRQAENDPKPSFSAWIPKCPVWEDLPD